MKIEIVTPPRSGTIALFSTLEAAKMSDNLNYKIITNRHEYNAFENVDNFNLFIARNPIDVIASILIYENAEYSDKRCEDLIEYINKFYYAFNKNDRKNVGYIGFDYLVQYEEEALRKILVWIGLEKSVAKTVSESNNFREILHRMKDKDKERVLDKQHFPRLHNVKVKEELKYLIGNNPNIKSVINSYNNTLTILGKTNHTVIKNIE